MSSRIYYNLDDANEIRLLHLQPRSRGEDIVSELQHVKLSDNPQYEALSYMWGPHHIFYPAYRIVLNGLPFRIRENLWSALSHLRLENDVRVLWIDAVCINQQNTRERNHQVTQMGRIYHSAQRVVAWLGPSEDSAAIGVIKDQVKLPFEDFEKMIREEFYDWKYKTRDDPQFTYLHSMSVNTTRVLKYLSTQGYWGRLWIIQELVGAQDILVKFGKEDERLNYSYSVWQFDTGLFVWTLTIFSKRNRLLLRAA